MLEPWDYLGNPLEGIQLAAAFGDSAVPVKETIDSETYVSWHEGGLAAVAGRDNRIKSVFLYGHSGKEGFSAFSGALPADLQWELSRNEVRTLLGVPHRFNDGRPGDFAPWDVYLIESFRVHLSYREDQPGIEMITVSRAQPAS